MNTNIKKLTHLELIPKQIKNIFILLHGYSSNAEDLFSLGMQFRDLLPNTAIISVNAPVKCEMQGDGYQWFSLKTMNLFSILKEIKTSQRLLNTFIDEQLKRFNLTNSNLILGGFSQGAILSLYTGLRRTPAPLAVLSFSGMLTDTVDTLKKEIQSKPKIFLCHGTADTMVPYNNLERTEKILREFDIDYDSNSIQGMGHTIDAECIEDARNFIKDNIICNNPIL
ncbi:MAG: hypothetical protein PHY80_01380 [Rickettsiales bacterium]|nr:hypothetical protein [Rickettsiales bacterium]